MELQEFCGNIDNISFTESSLFLSVDFQFSPSGPRVRTQIYEFLCLGDLRRACDFWSDPDITDAYVEVEILACPNNPDTWLDIITVDYIDHGDLDQWPSHWDPDDHSQQSQREEEE